MRQSIALILLMTSLAACARENPAAPASSAATANPTSAPAAPAAPPAQATAQGPGDLTAAAVTQQERVDPVAAADTGSSALERIAALPSEGQLPVGKWVAGTNYKVIAPAGGRDDFATLFHEGGHTEHFANVDPALPFEFRQLGDNAITEAYAFLFQHLIEDPEWLRRRLGVDDDGALASYARANRLVYLRRYTAKFAYELELHSDGGDGGLDALADRYAELLSAAIRVEWPREMFLADVDPGFYCTAYLRAWALETHLRTHFQRQFGPAWFDDPGAGQTLRALWHDGQRLSPEEMLRELTGERLDFSVLRGDLGLD